MIHKILFTVVGFVILMSFSAPIQAACSDPFSGNVIIDVPSLGRTVENAVLVAKATVLQLDLLKPKSSRCGTIAYSINISLRKGFLVVTMPPSLAGQIKDDEDWEDILPGLVFDLFEVDEQVESEELQTNACFSCTSVSVEARDTNGAVVEVRITYWGTFTCSGTNCTLTVGVLSVQLYNSDGTSYIGPGVIDLFAGTTYGGPTGNTT